jgi:hypothetical protein
MAASNCHHLGQVQRAQGRLDAAVSTYQQTLWGSKTGHRQLT